MTKKYCILLSLCALLKMNAQPEVAGKLQTNAEPPARQTANGDCTVVRSFTTSNTPAGLGFDGQFFYISSNLNTSIQKFDMAGQMVQSIPMVLPSVFYYGGDVDFDGTNLWRVVEQAGMLYKINPANGDILASYPVPTNTPDEPNSYGCAYDNGFIWTSEYRDLTLIKINAATGEVVQTFMIGRKLLPLKMIHGDLYGIVFTDSTSGSELTMAKIDRQTGTILEETPWCFDYTLGFGWANASLWSLDSSGFTNNELGAFLGNKTFAADAISVLPNPASDKVIVSGSQKIDQVEIYSLLGNKIDARSENGSERTIDVSTFSKGVYLLRITSGNKSETRKLIVK